MARASNLPIHIDRLNEGGRISTILGQACPDLHLALTDLSLEIDFGPRDHRQDGADLDPVFAEPSLASSFTVFQYDRIVDVAETIDVVRAHKESNDSVVRVIHPVHTHPVHKSNLHKPAHTGFRFGRVGCGCHRHGCQLEPRRLSQVVAVSYRMT